MSITAEALQELINCCGCQLKSCDISVQVLLDAIIDGCLNEKGIAYTKESVDCNHSLLYPPSVITSNRYRFCQESSDYFVPNKIHYMDFVDYIQVDLHE